MLFAVVLCVLLDEYIEYNSHILVIFLNSFKKYGRSPVNRLYRTVTDSSNICEQHHYDGVKELHSSLPPPSSPPLLAMSLGLFSLVECQCV